MRTHGRIGGTLLLFAGLMLAAPAMSLAADYYFSDCGCAANAACQGTFCELNPTAVGCISNPPAAGAKGNPWCLDPDRSGRRRSFDFLMDGPAPEAAAGDTIYLCAGACDGTGSATWYLQPHLNSATGRYVLFDPQIGSTSSVIINIRAHTGENVTISGDADADSHYTAGVDAQRFWDSLVNGSSTNAKTGYQLTGFTIEKFAERTFNIVYASGGPFIIDGMTVQKGGAGTIGDGYFGALTGDGGMAAMGCTNTSAQLTLINESVDNYATFIFGHNKNGASLTVRNSTIRQNCQVMVRSNGNCFGQSGSATATDTENCNPAYSAGDITIQNNTIYSVFGLHNGHQGRGWTWVNNVAYDFWDGLSAEENVIDVTLTDNDFSCRGTYKTDANGKCRTAIRISDGDIGEINCNDDGSGGLPHCGTRNVTIARNRIWGNASSPASGFLLGGIYYGAHNASSLNGGLASATIENNMIWYSQSSSGCNPFSSSNIHESPLSIASNDSITVRNNTLYNNGCPAYLQSGSSASAGGTGPVAHRFINNILSFSHYYSGGSNTVELFVDPEAAISTITNNNFHNGGDSATANLLCLSGTGSMSVSGGCVGGTYIPCASLPTLGTANICQPTPFRSVSGAKKDWDLHLALNDTVNKDRGTPGPLVDIDKQARAGACDIGADEVDSQDTQAPIPPRDVQVSQ
jgi:hypothetical protein